MLGKEFRLLAGGLAIAVCLGCGGGSSAFREGRKAAQRKDWDNALIKFERALQADPGNAQYALHEKLARTQASFVHLKRGRELLAAGRQDDAAGEFQKAASIDPTHQAAAQELARVLAQQAAAKRAREEALQEALKARDKTAEPAKLELKFPAEPLAHFRISADSRRVYETLAKLGNLNIAFTSDFQPRPVSIDLSNVSVEDAINILALQTKSFWKPVTYNTILVIQDTPANRREHQEEVLKTVYLSNPLAPADRTAITTALKQVLGLQRIIDNPDANAIIIRDTPAKVSAAERLIRDLDRGKAEILVEVAIMEADRNRLRDLGLTPLATSPLPSSAVAGIGFNPATAGGTDTIPALPLNRLGRISTRDFSIVLPGAIANAVLSDSQTRIIQSPQVRVTDGQTAKLRIGTRIPYATGSFLPSIGGVSGGGGFGLLASTQFQYQDVGVNLDLTPRLLLNGEVSLHAMIEISSLQAAIAIGGFSQPTFGQRRIELDIRLKEGEVSVLGGLIEAKESQSMSGLPGLGQIPFLRYFFSSERRERVETEILIMLTPRVIRLPELAEERGAGVRVGGEAAPPPEAAPLPEVTGPPGPPGQPQ